MASPGILLILAMTWAGCGRSRPTDPAADAIPVVDGNQAMALTREFVEIGPRPAGSEGAERAAKWIAAQARALGYAAHIDTWEEETPTGPVIFRNVIAGSPRAAGGRRRSRILIGSHFDTKRFPEGVDFQGANDSGSSTGLLLELMRVLQPQWPAAYPELEIAFFDGEECQVAYGPQDGLHGSKRLAARIADAEAADRYVAMILLDMVGDRDLTVTLPMDAPPSLAQALFAAAENQGTREAFGYARGSILDDHVPFQRLGIPSLDIIDFRYGPKNSYWHAEADRLDKLSAKSLATVGNVVLELLWHLAETAE